MCLYGVRHVAKGSLLVNYFEMGGDNQPSKKSGDDCGRL